MVGTMIVAAYVGATTVAALTAVQMAVAFAINFAVSQIVTRLFTDAPSSPQDNGVRQQVPPSTANSIPIVYGDAFMGGTFVDAVLSVDQKIMWYTIAVSSISPNGQFTFDQTKMYYGDRLISFDATDGAKVVSLTDEAGNVDTKIDGNLWIYLFKSDQAGNVTSLTNNPTMPWQILTGANVPTGLDWPSIAYNGTNASRRMNGLAFAVVSLVYSREDEATQLSPITFRARHYLNGTGAAKPGDVWYDYMTNAVYGGAVPAAFVDSASVTTLNTYSDQTITFNNSSGVPTTQARYRINGVLDAGQTVLSNVDKIVTACDSWMTYNAALGQWSLVINKAESASYAFNDNNIIGEIRVSATDITSSINQIEAKFPFKENRDQPSFVNLATPDLLLYPNEPVNKYSITYDLVNDSVQAQYLANRLLEQAREDLIVSFSTTYYGIQVDAGNVVSVTNSNYGWTNKLFRVTRVNEASLPDGSLGAKIELSEYSAAVYDDQDITQYTPVANSDIPSPNYFSALAAPTVIASRPSDAVPTFDVRVYVPTTGRVTYGVLYYTTLTSPGPFDWKVLATAGSPTGAPAANGAAYFWNNMSLPAGTYYLAFIVGNEIGQSALSPTSTAFVWSPIGAPGKNGLTAITAYLVQNQSSATPTFTTPTAGPNAPSGWSLTTPAVAVGQVLWYIQGQYNSNTTTIDGVAGGTTAWTGPIAASIFQDIRSDNWNGSNPPVAGTPATYGTAGYYIQRNTGDMFLNSVYGRGIAQFDGANAVSGGYTAAILANASLGQNIGIQGFTNNTFLTSGAIRGINSSAGGGNAIYANHSGTGNGILSQSSSGTGVRATGVTGVDGSGTTGLTGSGSSGGYGVTGLNTSGGTAIFANGYYGTNNSTLVTNLYADFAKTLIGTTSNQLRFVSGTSTGASAATFSGTKPGGASTNVWITMQIDATTIYIPVWT